MKAMTKKIISLCLAAMLFAGVFAFVPPGPVQAASHRVQNFKDEFKSPDLSPNWSTEDIPIKSGESVLRLSRLNIWQPSIALQAIEITQSCTVEFDIRLITGTSWLGVSFGLPAATSTFSDSKLMLMHEQSSVLFWIPDGGSFVETPSKKIASTPMTSAKNGNIAAVRYNLTKKSGNNYDIEVLWAEKGAQPKSYGTFTNVDADGFFGFCSMGGGVIDIMNFSVKSGNTVLFEDDFSEGSICYPASPDENSNWRVTHVFTKENVYCGYLYNLSFDDKLTGQVTCITPIASDKRSKKAFDIEMEVNIDLLSKETYFGIGFGLKTETAKIDSGSFLGFCSQTDNGAIGSLAMIRQGRNVTKSGDGGFIYGINGKRMIRFLGFSNGVVEVYIDGNNISRYTGVSVDGYFAVGVVSKSDEEPGNGNKLALTEFTLSTYTYELTDGKDIGIDFKGVKAIFDGKENIVDHYINTKNWYISGQGVSLPKRVDREYMQFIDATGDAGFGPKKAYSDFIVRFDLTVTQKEDANEKRSGWVGLSFGKKFIDTPADEGSIIHFFTPKATTDEPNPKMNITGINTTLEDGTTSKITDLNFWAGKDDDLVTYNVMIVVAFGTAEVYFKKSTDDVSQMSILRARFTDMNTTGYVSVACNTVGSRGNFRIGNFSIVNTSLYEKTEIKS